MTAVEETKRHHVTSGPSRGRRSRTGDRDLRCVEAAQARRRDGQGALVAAERTVFPESSSA